MTRYPHLIFGKEHVQVHPYDELPPPDIREVMDKDILEAFHKELDPYPSYSLVIESDYSLIVTVTNRDGDVRTRDISCESDPSLMLVELNILLKNFSPYLSYTPDPNYPVPKWG